MQCKYLINGENQCKLRTSNSSGYCHRHTRFEKPPDCPVCFASLHQTQRPLPCGHWVHRSCVKKSGRPICPLCRTTADVNIDVAECDDSDIFQDENVTLERFVIPHHTLVFAVIVYQLYTFIINPNRAIGLDHFISCCVNDIISIDHPAHIQVSEVLMGEALCILFNPNYW